MIEFIVPTWKRPHQLMMMLSSLMSQTNNKWKAHVVIDGMTNDYFNVKNHFQDIPNIRFSHIEGPNNDWGHTARNYGLSKAQEEFLVMTGDDNYYTPNFVDEMLKTANENGANLVFCNMIHNNYGYKPVNCLIAHGSIDIGNVMTRTKLAQQLELQKNYDADWTFITQYCQKNKPHSKSIIKIDKVLYIHN